MILIELTKFRLQYVTHSNDKFSHIEGAKFALEGGCRWIQLRMKKYLNETELLNSANELKKLCENYDAIFLINDYVELVKKVDADGVHLGKNDMLPSNARKILGENKIIGGTANTIEDIQFLAQQKVNYIGLGPFRFTTTKENLSQVLGIEGYTQIFNEIKKVNEIKNNVATENIPIVTIGGITKDDISDILKTGADGIAVSGAILNAENPTNETKIIIDKINKHFSYE